jgi:hypothetical protein
MRLLELSDWSMETGSLHFYVYIIYRDYEPLYRYVGKGSKRRVNQSLKERKGTSARIVFRTRDEPEAFRMEDGLWKNLRLRGFDLSDQRRPGRTGQWDELQGWKMPESAKEKIRAAALVRWADPLRRAKASQMAKIQHSLPGAKDLESQLKLGNQYAKGKTWKRGSFSSEHLQKISEKLKLVTASMTPEERRLKYTPKSLR